MRPWGDVAMALSNNAKAAIGLATIALLVVGAIGAVVVFGWWSLGGEQETGEPVTVEVTEGTTAAGVAEQLADEGVIRNALAFRLKARSAGLDTNLRAGTYEMETGMSVDQAIDLLLAGPASPVTAEGFRFTVPEGLTVEQILTRLGEQTPHSVEDYRAVLDAGELQLPDWVPDLSNLPEGVREPYEGLLFPETYELRADASPANVLQRMVDQLASVMEEVPDEQVAAMAEREMGRYEGLILGSLIEEETVIAEERPIVSGVIYNRLDAGMALQIDASNLYAANETGRVTEEYLEIDSPYNLYQVQGLPPTPISSPGRASIMAAFAPEQHGFLYYVKKNEAGEHAFAETFEQHQQNVQEFRELQREADAESRPASESPGG